MLQRRLGIILRNVPGLLRVGGRSTWKGRRGGTCTRSPSSQDIYVFKKAS